MFLLNSRFRRSPKMLLRTLMRYFSVWSIHDRYNGILTRLNSRGKTLWVFPQRVRSHFYSCKNKKLPIKTKLSSSLSKYLYFISNNSHLTTPNALPVVQRMKIFRNAKFRVSRFSCVVLGAVHIRVW